MTVLVTWSVCRGFVGGTWSKCGLFGIHKVASRVARGSTDMGKLRDLTGTYPISCNSRTSVAGRTGVLYS